MCNFLFFNIVFDVLMIKKFNFIYFLVVFRKDFNKIYYYMLKMEILFFYLLLYFDFYKGWIVCLFYF